MTVAMRSYRKRPVVIKAVQVPENLADFEEFRVYAAEKGRPIDIVVDSLSKEGPSKISKGYVKTLEGDMEFVTGDWIIQGVVGELYPCRDDIFQQTYEAA